MSVASAVQIIRPVDHKFCLEIDTLKRILGANELQDHKLVVVSIAGAFRKGKSFLLNFFLKYLDAQYKKHDTSYWIGENKEDSKVGGFQWRGGQKPETVGLWMWSEIYSHEYSNGEKIAIILLDTQGLFDDESSLKDCIATFAISMMISSVQLFNVTQQVAENDLNNLEMFTEYAKLAKEQTDDKPFQKLQFIVRDWPFPYENDYGYSSEYVDKLLTAKKTQTSEMRDLRERIRSSFGSIDAFLMPHPGMKVHQSEDFAGKTSDIDVDFIESVKLLSTSLFAPENLIVKRVNNGHDWLPSDLILSLETYVELFNGAEIPEPQSILSGTAYVSNKALITHCLEYYIHSMMGLLEGKSQSRAQPYFTEQELQTAHEDICCKTMSKKRKLGDEKLIRECQRDLEKNIIEEYRFCMEKNSEQLQSIAMAREELEKLYKECSDLYASEMESKFERVESHFGEYILERMHERSKERSLCKFQNTEKPGDFELIHPFQMKLQQDLGRKYKDFEKRNAQMKALAEAKLEKLYKECMDSYSSEMNRELRRSCFTGNGIQTLHSRARNEAISTFDNATTSGDYELDRSYLVKLDKTIDEKFHYFWVMNSFKRDKEILGVVAVGTGIAASAAVGAGLVTSVAVGAVVSALFRLFK